jgi:hypothetical protein
MSQSLRKYTSFHYGGPKEYGPSLEVRYLLDEEWTLSNPLALLDEEGSPLLAEDYA